MTDRHIAILHDQLGENIDATPTALEYYARWISRMVRIPPKDFWRRRNPLHLGWLLLPSIHKVLEAVVEHAFTNGQENLTGRLMEVAYADIANFGGWKNRGGGTASDLRLMREGLYADISLKVHTHTANNDSRKRRQDIIEQTQQQQKKRNRVTASRAPIVSTRFYLCQIVGKSSQCRKGGQEILSGRFAWALISMEPDVVQIVVYHLIQQAQHTAATRYAAELQQLRDRYVRYAYAKLCTDGRIDIMKYVDLIEGASDGAEEEADGGAQDRRLPAHHIEHTGG